MTVATLTLQDRTFDFLVARVPQHGRPLDEPLLVQEPLEVPGVDFTRWRDVHQRYQPYLFEGLVVYADYTAAMTAVRHLERWHDRLARLTWTLGGTTLRYAQVKIPAPPRVRLRRGFIIGTGQDGSSVKTLARMLLVLQHTEAPA